MGTSPSAAPLLPLGADEIHLWLAFDREINDPRLLAAYHDLLDEGERRQHQRFYFEKDRHQYLVTRALTRSVLSRYAPVAPCDWRFDKLEHGRPRIANPEPEAQSLVFNLTHSAGLIVLGITRGAALGIDTENVVEREPPLEISHRYLSPRETADLHALPRAAQPQRFFHYWTLKESYIKARSMGLALPLDQFSFSYADERSVAIGFDERLADTPDRWRFWLLRPGAEHLLAICATQRPTPQRLVLRRIVPLAQEIPLAAELLRKSYPG